MASSLTTTSLIHIHASERGIFILDTLVFRLQPEYNHIYRMAYVTKDRLETGMSIYDIQQHFDEFHMPVYFGDRANLSCMQVRDGYLNLISYFRAVFMDKVEHLLGVKIDTMPEEDSRLCILAECLSIIRASIKKYMRYRTSANQLLCRKSKLNIRNADEYGCPREVGLHEYCPSFEHLRKVRRKTCKSRQHTLENRVYVGNTETSYKFTCAQPCGWPCEKRPSWPSSSG